MVIELCTYHTFLLLKELVEVDTLYFSKFKTSEKVMYFDKVYFKDDEKQLGRNRTEK